MTDRCNASGVYRAFIKVRRRAGYYARPMAKMTEKFSVNLYVDFGATASKNFTTLRKENQNFPLRHYLLAA